MGSKTPFRLQNNTTRLQACRNPAYYLSGRYLQVKIPVGYAYIVLLCMLLVCVVKSSFIYAEKWMIFELEIS